MGKARSTEVISFGSRSYVTVTTWDDGCVTAKASGLYNAAAEEYARDISSQGANHGLEQAQKRSSQNTARTKRQSDVNIRAWVAGAVNSPQPTIYSIAVFKLHCTVCGCKADIDVRNCGCIKSRVTQPGNANGKCTNHDFKSLVSRCAQQTSIQGFKLKNVGVVTSAYIWKCDYCERAAIVRTHSCGCVDYHPVYIHRVKGKHCPQGDHYKHLSKKCKRA